MKAKLERFVLGDLAGRSVDRQELRAQSFVPVDHGLKSVLECGPIERTAQPVSHGNVVKGLPGTSWSRNQRASWAKLSGFGERSDAVVAGAAERG